MDQDKDKKNDTWSDLQAWKLRQSRFKEKRQRRKKEIEDIVSGISSSHPVTSSTINTSTSATSTITNHQLSSNVPSDSQKDHLLFSESAQSTNIIDREEVENKLLSCLCDAALKLPVDSRCLLAAIRKFINLEKSDHLMIVNLLEKFAHQGKIDE